MHCRWRSPGTGWPRLSRLDPPYGSRLVTVVVSVTVWVIV